MPQSKVKRNSFFQGCWRKNTSVPCLSATSFSQLPKLICHLCAVSSWRAEDSDKISCSCFWCETEFSFPGLMHIWKQWATFSFMYYQSSFEDSMTLHSHYVLRWRPWIRSFVGFHILRRGKWSRSLHYRLILRSQLQIPQTELYRKGPLIFSHSLLWTLE